MLPALAVVVAGAVSSPERPLRPSMVPEQIHTAVAGAASNGDSTGFSVMWFTASETTASVVRFGRSPGALASEVRGSAENYLEGWGYHHTAVVLGLHPAQVCFYQVGDGSTWSGVQRYKMTPGSAAATPAFNISIFGDMGYLGSDERPMVITIDGLKKHWSAVPTRKRLAHSPRPPGAVKRP